MHKRRSELLGHHPHMRMRAGSHRLRHFAHSVVPRGWHDIWDETNGDRYYADPQMHKTQRPPPPPHTQHNWMRRHTEEGDAYWVCTDLNQSFWEDHAHSHGWDRLVARTGRTYWSNNTGDVRFFEEPALPPVDGRSSAPRRCVEEDSRIPPGAQLLVGSTGSNNACPVSCG